MERKKKQSRLINEGRKRKIPKKDVRKRKYNNLWCWDECWMCILCFN